MRREERPHLLPPSSARIHGIYPNCLGWDRVTMGVLMGGCSLSVPPSDRMSLTRPHALS